MLKVKLVAVSLCILIANSLFLSISTAATTIDQTTIDAAKARIVEACPVRWEDHSQSLVLPTLASDVIWEDTADRTAFVTYMTSLLQEIGSTDNPEDIADDVGSVAAECATHRTALLDMLLVKEPNDIVISMRAMKRNLDELASAGKDGLTQENAARDCKTIKAAFPDSSDGTYWIDVTAGNSNDAVEVFCDMTFDGGGWTFVAFFADKPLNQPVEALKFFENAVGTYQSSRVITPDHYSLGILPELDDTEMIIVGANPDIQSAKAVKRFVQVSYDPHAPMFNFGPIPCTPSNFQFKTYFPDYVTGKSGTDQHCTDKYWTIKAKTTNNGDFGIMRLRDALSYIEVSPWVHNTTQQNISNNWFYVR